MDGRKEAYKKRIVRVMLACRVYNKGESRVGRTDSESNLLQDAEHNLDILVRVVVMSGVHVNQSFQRG